MGADMSQNIDSKNNFKSAGNRGALARLAAAALGASLMLCGAATMSGALAQTHQSPGAAHDPKASLSKFEARRIRHTCQEKANERGVKGAEREAFLTKCFFGRSALRSLRRDCAKQGAAKGLEKPALREFVRECVKEQRIKQKLPE
jgi:hypothetical protein